MTNQQNVIPATLNYHGFPASSCISINHVVCHGIPDDNKKLKKGDIVNIDVTVIKDGYHAVLDHHNLNYDLDWSLSGLPFITPAQGELIQAVTQATKTVMGYEPELSTGGGTSDGRFIAPTGAQVIELGPLNATIHQIDERVSISDLEHLTEIYYQTLVNLLAS